MRTSAAKRVSAGTRPARSTEDLPFGKGPGEYLTRGLSNRSQRVAACIALGEPAPFETVWLPGYDRPIVRCTRCLTLERQHKVKEDSCSAR